MKKYIIFRRNRKIVKYIEKIKDCFEEFTVRKKDFVKDINKIDYEFQKILFLKGDMAFSGYAIELKKVLSKEEIELFKNEIHKNEISKKEENNREFYIDKDEILSYLKKLGLNTKERKEQFNLKVKELAELFLKMVDGDKESYNLFNEKYQSYVFSEENKDYYARNIPMGVIIYLIEVDGILKDLKEKFTILSLMPYSNFKFLITDCQYSIGVALGLRKKKNALDILEDTKSIMNNFSNEEHKEEEQDAQEYSELEKLKFERDNLKNSLMFIENNFNELREKIEEEALDAKKSAIGEFFVTLNSEKYGKFLDKVPYTEELLTKIRKGQLDKEIPSEIKSTLMFIKQVIKFIKDSGIEPIEKYNKVFTGTADEIANMNYIGEPFFSDDEVKELKVDAPGYKYKDITISIPTVSEVKN